MRKNKIFTLFILCVVVPLIVIFSVRQGLASSDPVKYAQWTSGNASAECAIIGGYSEGVRIGSLSAGVSKSSGSNTITINGVNFDADKPVSFSWSSTSGVGAVIVVSDPGANVWFYNPQKSGGSGLYGFNQQSIDHVTFCWNTPPQPTNTLAEVYTSTATEVPESEITNTPPAPELDFTPTSTLEDSITATPTQTSTDEEEDEQTPTPTETVIVDEETPTPTPTETGIIDEETPTYTPTPTLENTETPPEEYTPTPTLENTEIPPEEYTPTPTLENTEIPPTEFTPTPTAEEPKPEPSLDFSMKIASINGDPAAEQYFQAGDEVVYSISLINTGNVDLMNVTVSDPLNIISGDPIDILAAGELDNSSFAAVYVITQDDVNRGSFTDVATAVATSKDGSIVISDVSVTVYGPNEIPSIQLDIEVAAINGDSSATYFKQPGDKITYAFTITNTGNVTLENISISDPLAVVSEIIIESLAPGESDSASFTAVYIITQSDYDARLFTNTAIVSGSSLSGNLVTDEAFTTVEREKRRLY